MFGFLPVDEILHQMGFTVRPRDKLMIVDETNCDSVTAFGGVP